ncbi:aminopeptidase P Metallo peptidase. MEROPS family M24B [Andreprevotia lacus DSM 23236]|jgi:Xaa-Pro aminopeptidase|uniref:Xaa-Pro aminopeptidase n=1 Tax=Andreprevotia lacus DSM 23236 TaxID=1121001 RepID=A0A1W1Y0P3_9NEIS|nr:aminopeptidase P N-terminal domain-containing protein [Andreprevotia lacus]SMC29790.1 aminopeptidase P Metallo peptidase. MEROPS family M24B [Andreprevotia lacus DSM 23236]
MQPYSSRRARLAAQLSPGLLILPTSPELARNADTGFPYRFDSSFYYLTGFAEPEAVLVIETGGKPRSILFCRDKDIEREIWDGYRYGPAAAGEKFGFDEAHSINELDSKLIELLKNQPRVHFPLGADAGWDSRLTGWLNGVRGFVRAGINVPTEVADPRDAIAEMRLFKDEHELAILQRAADINVAAHKRAMRTAVPGTMEYAVEAELLHEYCRNGARFPAYGSIVATGANACVLHYVENTSRIADGDLLLIDAGGEYEGYASDITRTFPANGKFSGPQKAVYEVVLAAHAAARGEARPGKRWNDMHDAAVNVLAQGLLDLKLLDGSLQQVLETESYRQFYMHRTGHWMGLDVHDAGAYKINGEWRELQPGMVFTIEPGLYIRPAANVPSEFANIGIRIEDDAIVTASGHTLLTEGCPRSVAEIENWIAESRK